MSDVTIFTKPGCPHCAGLKDDLRQRGVAAQAIGSADAIAAAIAADAAAGDVVVLMSNGAFGGLRGKLTAALRA